MKRIFALLLTLALLASSGAALAAGGYTDVPDSHWAAASIQSAKTYGLMSGCGAGLIYLPPVGLAPKWWPDRKALATGVIVLGLGIGSSLMAPVSNWIIENLSWRYVFRYCGVIMALISCLPGLLLTAPPDGWSPHGRTPIRAGRTANRHDTGTIHTRRASAADSSGCCI